MVMNISNGGGWAIHTIGCEKNSFDRIPFPFLFLYFKYENVHYLE